MSDSHMIEDRIRAFIIGSFLTEASGATFQVDDDLLKALDSLQILRLVIAMEREFEIKVEDGDMSVENLGSVRRLATLIQRKRCNGGTGVGNGWTGETPVPPKVREE